MLALGVPLLPLAVSEQQPCVNRRVRRALPGRPQRGVHGQEAAVLPARAGLLVRHAPHVGEPGLRPQDARMVPGTSFVVCEKPVLAAVLPACSGALYDMHCMWVNPDCGLRTREWSQARPLWSVRSLCLLRSFLPALGASYDTHCMWAKPSLKTGEWSHARLCVASVVRKGHLHEWLLESLLLLLQSSLPAGLFIGLAVL